LYIWHCVLFSDGAVHISGDSLSTEWTTKSVRQWAPDDVLCWIISVANDHKLNAEDIDMSHFRKIDGTALYKMSEEDFVSKESQYGKLLYCSLQRLKQEQDQQMAYDSNKREFFFFSSVLYVKVVCLLHVQYKMAKWVWLQWYAVMLMLLDKFNFRHQFSLQTLLKDKQHFTFLRTGMQQANT
jgi:hypothetical protein